MMDIDGPSYRQGMSIMTVRNRCKAGQAARELGEGCSPQSHGD